jgi:hypothetical protein
MAKELLALADSQFPAVAVASSSSEDLSARLSAFFRFPIFAAAAAVAALIFVGGLLWFLSGGPKTGETEIAGSRTPDYTTRVTPTPAISEPQVSGSTQPSSGTSPVTQPAADKPSSTPSTPKSSEPAKRVTKSPAQLPIVPATVLLPLTRSSGELPAVRVAPGRSATEFKLVLEFDDHLQYRVSLNDPATGETVWTSGRLRSSSSGGKKLISLSVPNRSLRSRVGSLTVNGLTPGGDEIVGDYPFRIVR